MPNYSGRARWHLIWFDVSVRKRRYAGTANVVRRAVAVLTAATLAVIGGSIGNAGTAAADAAPIWTTVGTIPNDLDPSGWAPFAAVTGSDGQIYLAGESKQVIYDPRTNEWKWRGERWYNSIVRGIALTATSNGFVHLVGGFVFDEAKRWHVRYDVSLKQLAEMPMVPTARAHPAAAAGVDGRIYAIGGQGAHGGPLSSTEAYDPATGTWHTVAHMTVPRVKLAATTGADGLIYAFGGHFAEGGDPLATVEAYNPQDDTWTMRAPMPTARYQLAAVTGPDGKIYVIGGRDHLGAVDTIEVYDPATDTWTSLPPVKGANEATAAVADGRIFLFGNGKVQATQANAPHPHSTYVVRQADRQNVAVTVKDARTEDSTPIIAAPLNNATNQRWTFQPSARYSGWYHLVEANSNKCMDVEGASAEWGAAVKLYTCDPNYADQPNQLWQPRSAGGTANADAAVRGNWSLINMRSGMALTRSAAINGASFSQAPYTATSHQLFQLKKPY